VSEHAILPPSSAGMWGHCSGSRAASSRFSDEETEANRLGTAAHELAELCLRADFDVHPSMFLGQQMSNGIVVDQEMVNCAEIYVDDVKSVATQHRIVEQRVYMPQIHEQNWGTVDCAAYVPAENRVYLWDYKHGHRQVKAYESFQHINYSLGLINHWNIAHEVEFVFRVVQPRCYSSNGPIDEWRVRSSQLVPFYEQLKRQAHEALGPSPTLTTGLHCRDCPAVGVCSAARDMAYNAMDYVGREYELDVMSDNDVGFEFELLTRALQVIKKRHDALADDVRHRIENGSVSTGYSLESKVGSWKWRDGDDDVIKWAKDFGVDAEVKSTKTVAQVRAELPAAQRKEFDVMRPVIAKQSLGTVKLVPTADSLSARVFGGKR